jgi:hypothetical protein
MFLIITQYQRYVYGFPGGWAFSGESMEVFAVNPTMDGGRWENLTMDDGPWTMTGLCRGGWMGIAPGYPFLRMQGTFTCDNRPSSMAHGRRPFFGRRSYIMYIPAVRDPGKGNET